MNEQEIIDRAKRAAMTVDELDQPYDALLRRRDRKRRNQRIAAGVVGIAVFVAAVWIVWDVASLDRSEPSVPAVSGTTGPAETGPVETGPTVAPDTRVPGSGFRYRIPAAGTAVSTPVEGELIAESKFYPSPYVRVYADGRVLSTPTPGVHRYVERRLSPEGVELVRSGAVQPKDLVPECLGCALDLVPESAWEDSVGIPYVPARYGACFWFISPLEVEAALDLLPASAQALLSGSDPAWNPQCLILTPEEARSLEEILSQARSSVGDDPLEVGRWSLRDGNGDPFISVRPLFPDGRRFFHIPF